MKYPVCPEQLANKPMQDNDSANTSMVIGPKAKKSLVLEIPVFVLDMSFGSLFKLIG